MAKKKSKKQAQTLLEAVESGELNRLRELIQAGAEVDESEEETALGKAAELGNAEMVRELLNAGADVNFGALRVPLCQAVTGGNEEVVKLLLEAGAKVDAQEEEGSTALMIAAFKGNLTLVQMLIKAGADPKMQDEDGQTAIVGAKKWPKIVAFLTPLSEKEDVSYLAEKEVKPAAKVKDFIAAAEKGNSKQVEQMLTTGVDLNGVDEEKETALHKAAEAGHTKVVGALLKHGVKVDAKNKYNRTPLWVAANGYQLKTARQLIDAGADVNARDKLGGMTPFLSCIETSHNTCELLRLLANRGADIKAVDDYGRSALNLAQRKLRSDKDEAALQALFIEIGLVDANAGKLSAAAAKGDLQTVQKLITSGVSPDANDDEERTPLYMAITRQQQEVVAYLLKAKADVHKKIGTDAEQDVQWGGIPKPCPQCGKLFTGALRKRTCPHCGKQFDTNEAFGSYFKGPPMFVSWNNDFIPLMAAAKMGNTKITGMLLDAGADVNKGKSGVTPLMTACYYNHLEVAKLLVKHGADVKKESKAPDRSGEKLSAVKIAANGKNLDLVKLLWDAGVPATDKKPTLLVDAARRGDIGAIKKLIAEGANASAEDPLTKDVPLMVAAKEGHADAVTALLEAGAPANPPTARQPSALLEAVGAIHDRSRGGKLPAAHMDRYVATVKKLIDAGAKVKVNFFGFSPLGLATEEIKHEPLTQLLQAAAEKEKKK